MFHFIEELGSELPLEVGSTQQTRGNLQGNGMTRPIIGNLANTTLKAGDTKCNQINDQNMILLSIQNRLASGLIEGPRAICYHKSTHLEMKEKIKKIYKMTTDGDHESEIGSAVGPIASNLQVISLCLIAQSFCSYLILFNIKGKPGFKHEHG